MVYKYIKNKGRGGFGVVDIFEDEQGNQIAKKLLISTLG